MGTDRLQQIGRAILMERYWLVTTLLPISRTTLLHRLGKTHYYSVFIKCALSIATIQRD